LSGSNRNFPTRGERLVRFRGGGNGGRPEKKRRGLTMVSKRNFPGNRRAALPLKMGTRTWRGGERKGGNAIDGSFKQSRTNLDTYKSPRDIQRSQPGGGGGKGNDGLFKPTRGNFLKYRQR